MFVRGLSSSKKLLKMHRNLRGISKLVRRDRKNIECIFIGVSVLLLAGTMTYNQSICDGNVDFNGVHYQNDQVISNWSATHGCRPNRIYEPKSAQEVCRILKSAHMTNDKVRPIGTALSPNGIGLSGANLLSLSSIDYIEVDPLSKSVTVGAGARVSDVLKELRRYGLTLENFSSIQEQQIAGWTQVSAHGTGCKLSTVDEMIVRMKLATPTEGLMTLSEYSNPKLFSMAKVGLGSLGVVTEVTLKCVPRFRLKETTQVLHSGTVQDGHYNRLANYRHVRYMWLPHTNKVVSVVSDPVADEDEVIPSTIVSDKQSALATKPLSDLLLSVQPTFDREKAEKLSHTQLRDLLLDHAPLKMEHIKAVNSAEAQYWETICSQSGERIADSTEILGFDCGGEQLVYEVCFPIGTLAEKTGKDLHFVKQLTKIIAHRHLPAPCPIEQRWTARSTSPMSPAYSTKEDEVFCWVGVIMYLPPGQSAAQREAIKKKFYEDYVGALQPLLKEYNAHCHWAKIELPAKDSDSSGLSTTLSGSSSSSGSSDSSSNSWWSSVFGGAKNEVQTYDQKLAAMQSRLAERFPLVDFNNYRKVLDPRGVLSNPLIDELFGDVSLNAAIAGRKRNK